MTRPLFRAALCFAALAVSCAKDRVDGETLLLYAKASAFYDRGNFRETAALLSGAGNFIPALALRGKALYFCGDTGAAETALRRALRLNPSAAEASLFLARLLRDRGMDEEARVLTEALIRDNPQDIRALRLASDLAAGQGDGEGASAFLDRAVDASVETALVFIDRARLRWAGGNGKDAVDDLSRAEALLSKNTPLAESISGLRLLIASKTRPDQTGTGEEASR